MNAQLWSQIKKQQSEITEAVAELAEVRQEFQTKLTSIQQRLTRSSGMLETLLDVAEREEEQP